MSSYISDALSTSVSVLLDGKESALDFIDIPYDQVSTLCSFTLLTAAIIYCNAFYNLYIQKWLNLSFPYTY